MHVNKHVVRRLLKRAHDISAKNNLLKDEIRHLKTVLEGNGYPASLKKLSTYNDTQRKEEEEANEIWSVTTLFSHLN